MAKRQRSSYSDAERPATLADVALEAGVGSTTVSRVLNGAHYVHAGTLARVQAAMDKLGYTPSHAARALKGERSRTLGLIVPSLRDEFFASLAHDTQLEAKARGYVLLVLTSADEASRQIEEIAILRSHRVDGAILVPPRTYTRAFLQEVRKLRAPVVAVDRPLSKATPFVGCDNYAAAARATRHLLAHGRRRILFAGGDPEIFTIRERERGYVDAMAEAGLEPMIFSSAAEPSAAAELERRFKMSVRRRPDAVFGSLNVATMAAFSVLRKLALRIPEEVALLGFDDFPASELLTPPISVVRQPVEAIGRVAIRLLVQSVEQEKVPSREVIQTSEFVPRRSCGCAE